MRTQRNNTFLTMARETKEMRAQRLAAKRAQMALVAARWHAADAKTVINFNYTQGAK